jgi:hypothetical protein
MRRIRFGLSLFALALAAIGCAPSYGSVDFDPISAPPAFVDISEALIVMPAGVAVVVQATLHSDSREDYDDTYRLDLISRDRDVFTTFRRPDDREFTLVGVLEGQTCLEVRIEGDVKDCIDVEIQAPAR